MEEKKNLLARIATQHMKKGFRQLGEQYRKQAAEWDIHIKKMKELLFTFTKS